MRYIDIYLKKKHPQNHITHISLNNAQSRLFLGLKPYNHITNIYSQLLSPQVMA